MFDYKWLCEALSQTYPDKTFFAYHEPIRNTIIFLMGDRKISVPLHLRMSQAIDMLVNEVHRKSKIKWTRLERL
jgi:hypothetical protein